MADPEKTQKLESKYANATEKTSGNSSSILLRHEAADQVRKRSYPIPPSEIGT